MSVRMFARRAWDVGVSMACVATAPIAGAVAGAVVLTGAMALIAYFVITEPNDD